METKIEIFVIDDDPDMIDVYKEILSDIDNVTYFTDPDMLLETLNDCVRICIVDYMLESRINGLQLVKQIAGKCKFCWFIMVSGQNDIHVIVDYLNSVNGSRYIEKGGEMKDILIKQINEIIEHIHFVENFYHNTAKIEQGFADLKNIVKKDA